MTSTVGFLSAPLAFDFVRTSYGRLDELDWATVNGIFDLPGFPKPPIDDSEPSRTAVPRYFAAYERAFDLPVYRPVTVTVVDPLTAMAAFWIISCVRSYVNDGSLLPAYLHVPLAVDSARSASTTGNAGATSAPSSASGERGKLVSAMVVAPRRSA